MSKRNTAYKEDRKCLFPIPVLPVSCQSEEVHIVWQLLQLHRHLLALCVFVSVFVCLCLYLATEDPGKNPRPILLLPQFCRNKIRHRKERERERPKREREEGRGRRRIVCVRTDCLWGRTGRWLGSNLERTRCELCWMASRGGKRMDGWMDGFRSKCTWLFFFLSNGSSFFFFFFFSFGFPRKLKGKRKGKWIFLVFTLCTQQVGRCTTSYLLAGPVCLWCLVTSHMGKSKEIQD